MCGRRGAAVNKYMDTGHHLCIAIKGWTFVSHRQIGTLHCICMPSAPYEVVTAQLASDWPGRWRVNYKNSLPSVTEACFPVNQQVPRLLLGNRHLITHLFVLLVFVCVSKDAQLNWGTFHCIAWLAHLYPVGDHHQIYCLAAVPWYPWRGNVLSAAPYIQIWLAPPQSILFWSADMRTQSSGAYYFVS